ncbi:heavy-metal-associated domain-containing protein [Microbacterium halotolerans]|uniref:heavy-metal-associated domain-containing protein n=1 Tax=Microbacterium halotolerans TaxID=246613 RepID=UPI000E6AC9E7|nr:cation transporter [Microbacterium halotolerans]
METQRIELGLTDATQETSCGCGGCGDAGAAETAAPAAAETTTVQVEGMTCGHCVSAVTEEVSKIDGVEQVSVDLVAGGISTVTIGSAAAVDPAALRSAIDEAGYSIAA